MSCEEGERLAWVQRSATRAGIAGVEQRDIVVASQQAYQRGVGDGIEPGRAAQSYREGATLALADMIEQGGGQLLREGHLQSDGMPSDRVQQGYTRQLEHAVTNGLVPAKVLSDMAKNSKLPVRQRQAATLLSAKQLMSKVGKGTKMKPHDLVAAYRGVAGVNFGEVAKRASILQKAGNDDQQVLAQITQEFGIIQPPTMQQMHKTPRPYKVFGAEGIEQGAISQLETALKLPIAIDGALMPDAHPGYALPVGGVFRAHRAVSPQMVGVDIGCRVTATVFEVPSTAMSSSMRRELFEAMKASTTFGTGIDRPTKADHAVMDDPRWKATAIGRSVRDRAASQLGTSGSGNHFADLMTGTLFAPIAGGEGIPRNFIALVTHSGSRGAGARIADHYTKIARQETAKIAQVPPQYEWLSIDSEAGQEYLAMMQLADAYAAANHEVIHNTFARMAGLVPVFNYDNSHNLAWVEGDAVTHRKGATPAHKGQLGLIPGSMADAAYIVIGQGNADSLESASHGAGRVGSRTKAKATINPKEMRQLLADRNIEVAGFSVDESSAAYKNIEEVIAVQERAGILTVAAKMQPFAVKMAGEEGNE